MVSGDVNPAHLDEEYAHSDMFHAIIAHGMWGASLISTLLGTGCPAPARCTSSRRSGSAPVMIGDRVTVSVSATANDQARHTITFDCRCVNQRGEAVIDGTATVIALTGKVRRPQVALPEVRQDEHASLLGDLVERAASLPPVRQPPVGGWLYSASISAAKSLATMCLRTLPDGVSWPESSVKSAARIANRRIDSARDTALFASSTTCWISAIS